VVNCIMQFISAEFIFNEASRKTRIPTKEFARILCE